MEGEMSEIEGDLSPKLGAEVASNFNSRFADKQTLKQYRKKHGNSKHSYTNASLKHQTVHS